MSSILEIPGAGWIIGIAGLAILGAFAYYCLSAFRGMATGESDTEIDHLSSFQEMKSAGMLSHEEFQRLKANPAIDGRSAETDSAAPTFEEVADSETDEDSAEPGDTGSEG